MYYMYMCKLHSSMVLPIMYRQNEHHFRIGSFCPLAPLLSSPFTPFHTHTITLIEIAVLQRASRLKADKSLVSHQPHLGS